MKLLTFEKRYVAWKAMGGEMTPSLYRDTIKFCGVQIYQSVEKRVIDYVPAERKRRARWVKL